MSPPNLKLLVSIERAYEEFNQMIKNLHMTDLTTFQSCRKKFYFDKVLRITTTSTPREMDNAALLSPDTDPQFPMTFGTIGHKVMEDYYARQIPLLHSFRDHGRNLRGDYYEIGESIFTEYDKEYPDDFSNWEILLVETPITVTYQYFDTDGVTVIEQDIELNVDLLIKIKSTGALYAVDHKFYASMPNQDELHMRDQFTGYVTSIRHSGQNIAGVMVNVLRKGVVKNPTTLKDGVSLSRDKTQLTTYHRYKVQVDFLAMQGIDVTPYDDILEYLRTNPHPLLRREIVLKSKAETDSWAKRLQPRLTDITRALHNGEQDFYPNPGRDCLKCMFLKICQAQLQGGSGAGYMEQMFRTKEDTER